MFAATDEFSFVQHFTARFSDNCVPNPQLSAMVRMPTARVIVDMPPHMIKFLKIAAMDLINFLNMRSISLDKAELVDLVLFGSVNDTTMNAIITSDATSSLTVVTRCIT